MTLKNPSEQFIEPVRFVPLRDIANKTQFNIAFGSLSMYAIATIFIVILWYVLTARSVSIITSPEIASVNVKSWPSPKIGNRWLLRPGKQRLEVRSDGYHTFVGQLEITEDDIQTHNISLIPLPGDLKISLKPIERADIYIDGQPYGSIPGLVKNVEAGQRLIEIRADRYVPFDLKFNVEGKRTQQTLDVRLEPAWADLKISSSPAAAQVHIDEKVLGLTPADLEVLFGNRTLTLKKAGYKTWKKKIKVKPGQTINMGTIALSKADGYLKLTSIPDKVTVTFNGDFKGETPLTINVSPEKNHLLKFIKKGYQIQKREMTVDSNITRQINVEMLAEIAPVYFSTVPKDAELLINGESKGFATQLVELPTYEHEILIRRKGYATYQTKITPRKNFEKRVRIRLKTIEEAEQKNAIENRAKRTSSADTTYTGQKMKLFENAVGVLGSPKNETGRQSDEPLRKVVLKRAFYLSEKEVSNLDYRKFFASHSSGAFKKLSLDDNKQPVSNVSWMNAVLYCNWLSRRDGLKPFYVIKYGELLGFRPDSTGYRLPTEAEWEWALKTTPEKQYRFPWGSKMPPPNRTENFADKSAINQIENIIQGYNDGFVVSSPVGSFSSNEKGLFDLHGNVAEWVHDFYEARPETRTELDPLGPISGSIHVIKGASWKDAAVKLLRSASRDSGYEAQENIGFRVARYAR